MHARPIATGILAAPFAARCASSLFSAVSTGGMRTGFPVLAGPYDRVLGVDFHGLFFLCYHNRERAVYPLKGLGGSWLPSSSPVWLNGRPKDAARGAVRRALGPTPSSSRTGSHWRQAWRAGGRGGCTAVERRAPRPWPQAGKTPGARRRAPHGVASRGRRGCARGRRFARPRWRPGGEGSEARGSEASVSPPTLDASPAFGSTVACP